MAHVREREKRERDRERDRQTCKDPDRHTVLQTDRFVNWEMGAYKPLKIRSLCGISLSLYIYIYKDSTGKKAHVTDLIKQNINFPVFTFQRQYFPLQPCFGLTINTAQGETLQFVELDLRTPAFSNGMLWKSKMLLYQICDMCLFSVESSYIYIYIS